MPHDLSDVAFTLLKETEERRAHAAAHAAAVERFERGEEARDAEARGGALDDYRCPNGCGSHRCGGRCAPDVDRPPRWER
jgi:hypothetical protein